jgi:hypothetical protein
MIDDECGAVGGMRIGRGNQSTRRKPAPVPLCPPQIPHDLIWARARTAAVGSRRLAVWAMAPPCRLVTHSVIKQHKNEIITHAFPPSCGEGSLNSVSLDAQPAYGDRKYLCWRRNNLRRHLMTTYLRRNVRQRRHMCVYIHTMAIRKVTSVELLTKQVLRKKNVTWSRDPSLLLRHPSVYSCCQATKEAWRGEARRGEARRGDERLLTARLG